MDDSEIVGHLLLYRHHLCTIIILWLRAPSPIEIQSDVHTYCIQKGNVIMYIVRHAHCTSNNDMRSVRNKQHERRRA
jgi:hypothetical protein